MYLDAYYSNAAKFGKRVHGINFPYHLAWVNDDGTERPYRDLLTHPEYLCSDTTNSDYQTFQKTLKTLWQNRYPAPLEDPITQWTKQINAILPTDLDTARSERDAAQLVVDGLKGKRGKEMNDAKKALKAAEKKVTQAQEKFTPTQNKVFPPYLRPMWDRQSATDRTYYPVRAFDDDDTLPTKLQILDYIKVTFTQAPKLPTIAKGGNGHDYVTQFAAEKAKTKKAKVDDAKGKRVVSGLLGDGEGGGSRKRKLESRPEGIPATAFPVLSLANELTLINNQLDGELELGDGDNADPEDMDTGENLKAQSTVSVSRGLQSALLQSTPATAYDYIYPADGTPASGVLNVDAFSNADYFISGIPDGHLSIEGGAVLPTDTTTWAYGIRGDDNFSLWLQSFFKANADNVLPSVRLKAADSSLAALNLIVNKLGSSIVKPLTYSSSLTNVANALSLSPASPPPDLTSEIAGIIDSVGFLQKSSGIVFGLIKDDSSSKASLSLGDIFDFLGLDLPFFLNGSAQLAYKFTASATNGLWVAANPLMSTTYRMSLTGSSSFLVVGSEFPGFTFTDWDVVATKQAYLHNSVDGNQAQDYIVQNGSFCIHATTRLTDVNAKWDAYIGYDTDKARIMLRFNDTTGDPVSLLLGWMATQLGMSAQASWDSLSNARTSLNSSFSFREVAITAIHDTQGWHFESFSMVFELDLTWGINNPASNPEMRVPLQFSLLFKQNGNSPSIIFSGGLWPAISPTQAIIERLNPGAALYPILLPVRQNPKYRISLNSLSGTGKASSLPPWFPTDITGLNLTLAYDAGSKTSLISFKGTMSAPVEAPRNALWSLDWVSISASYSTTSATLGELKFSFDATMNLRPRDYSLFNPVVPINLSVDYQSGPNGSSWSIAGGAADLNGGFLYSLFPGTEKDAVMDILQDITITGLLIEFFHDTNKTSFESTGSILLGDVELDLTFNYTK